MHPAAKVAKADAGGEDGAAKIGSEGDAGSELELASERKLAWKQKPPGRAVAAKRGWN